MGKIQDFNFWYSALRPFVDYHTRRSFHKCAEIGLKNIPKDGACIYGSNHCSALVDALVLLQTTWRRKVFIARADIFKKPMTAKILRWLRILPIFRLRDGLDSVRDKNGEIIDEAVDVIRDEVPLYLFPEATHRTKHSLRQLSKGIFHIALEANRKFGHEKPVYIIPTGLEYGDYFRFRQTVVVSYGKPINVTEFVKEHEGETEAQIINQLRTLLTEKIAELISYIPDDEDYDAIWEMVKIKGRRTLRRSPKTQLDINRQYIKEILELKKKSQTEAAELFQKVKEFKQHRVDAGVSSMSVSKKVSIRNLLSKTLWSVLGFPYFILSFVLSSPIWLVNWLIQRKLKDPAFKNTVNTCVELVLHPIINVTGMVLLFCLTPMELAVFASIYLYISYVLTVEYVELVRLWISDLRWAFDWSLRREFKAMDLYNILKKE